MIGIGSHLGAAIVRLAAGLDRTGHLIGRGGSALIGVCAIALVWAGIFHNITDERARTGQTAMQNSSNLSRGAARKVTG